MVVQRARWYRPVSIVRSIVLRPRIYLAMAAAILALLLLPSTLSPNVREVLAWIIGATVYLTSAIQSMLNCPSTVIAARAGRIDDSRMVILAIVLAAIAASFLSIAGLITEAKEAARHVKLMYLGLASTTIIVSWAVTQVVFTLHYAHEYYRPRHRNSGAPVVAATGAVPAASTNVTNAPVSAPASEPELQRGLDFPGESQPDYWDFLYFATSIGATSQTSDVAVRSRALRRLVTVHAVVSFFFNATVLALTINLAASLI